MAIYTKRPHTIEAFEYGGENTVPSWFMPYLRHKRGKLEALDKGKSWILNDDDGNMICAFQLGDYICKDGEDIFSRKPDAFRKTYLELHEEGDI